MTASYAIECVVTARSMEPFDLIDLLRDKDRLTRSDVESLSEMSERHPDCPELWDVLGDIQRLCVDHEYKIGESIACYRKAIDCDPQYTPAHVSLGYAYRRSPTRIVTNRCRHEFRRSGTLVGRPACAHSGKAGCWLEQKSRAFR